MRGCEGALHRFEVSRSLVHSVHELIDERAIVVRSGAEIGGLDILADGVERRVRLRTDLDRLGQLPVGVTRPTADVQRLKLGVDLLQILEGIGEAQGRDLGRHRFDIVLHAQQAAALHFVGQFVDLLVRMERGGESEGSVSDIFLM